MSVTTRRALWWGLRRIVAPLAAFVLLATQLVLPTPVEAATVTFRSAATAVSAGDGVLEIATPEGVEPGDLLIAQIATTDTATAATPPPGWTLIRQDSTPDGNVTSAIYYRITTAEEPATHTWIADDPGLPVGSIVAYTGVDSTDPVADHRGNTALGDDGALAAPSVASTRANSMLVAAFTTRGPESIAAPDAMDVRVDTGGTSDPAAILLADEQVATKADTGDRIADTSGGTAGVAQLVVLNPTLMQPVDPPEEESENDPPESEPTEPDVAEPSEPESKRPKYLMEFEAVADGSADFVAKGRGYDIVLDDAGATLTLGKGSSRHEVSMTLRDADAMVAPTGVDSVMSATQSELYAAVAYPDVYPGIDVIYSGNGRELEYGFVVDAGADPNMITLEFTGARGLEVAEDGTLTVDSRAGRDLTTTSPIAYQTIDGTRVPVESDYQLNDDDTLSFTLGDYNPAFSLVIDPTFKSVETAGGMRPSGGILDLDVPTGVDAGDLLIAQVAYNASGTITAPAGWTTIDVITNATRPMMQGLYWREATASEPTHYSFTLTSTGSDTAAGAIAAYSNVDTSDPIDAFAGQANGTSTTITAPSITTTQPNTTLIAFYAVRDDGTLNPPAGMTERWDTNSNAGVGAAGETLAAAADQDLAGVGATGTRAATAQASDGSIGHLIALTPTPATTPMAVWRRSGQSTPFYRGWNASTFGGTGISQSVGDFKIIQGAESPSRDEAIVVGVAEGGTIAGEMWDGISWSALPALGSTTQDYWWSVDVAYEPVSGDAVVVYADGGALNYRVWNGATWSGENPIPEAPGGTPRQMQLAAHPYSDEMVLIVSNDSSQDYAVVWDGSAWGNGLTLDSTGSGNDRTDVSVAYEQQSGRALVVWGSGNDDVHFRLWDSGWSNEFVTPGIGGFYARWITLGADPNSNNVAMGVIANDQHVWLSVWTGAGWVNQTTATTGTTGTTELSVAVGFEGTSGQALATYGENVLTPRYRTWTNGSGWSTEGSLPNIGAVSNSMALYPEPGTDGAMLAVNDDSWDIHYLYWNGSTWGADNELEVNSGETKNQPFLFLWEGASGSPPPTYSISGTVFEDVAGDVLNDGSVGDANNPGVQNTDVHLYLDVDGDGIAEATDTYQTTVQTDANGDYSFPGLSNGKYFVVVDSKTFRSTALATSYSDIWAEQTFGPSFRFCSDGMGGTVAVVPAGPCYGGRRGGVSDDLTTWYSGAEHYASVSIASADVTNVDYGFSFNAVSTTAGGDTQDDDPAVNNRSVQGSLRQFITNANTINDANVMRFVPAEPTNATDGANDWWQIKVTTGLPVLTGANTTIDGTAYDLINGTSVTDTNTAGLGTAGDVGVGPDGRPGTGDEQGIASVPGPELEIGDGVISGRVSRGLDTDADGTTIRAVAVWGFVTSIRGGGDGGDTTRTGFLLEDAVVGTTATGVDPGAEASTTGVYFDDWSTGTIQGSYIAHATNVGASFWVGLPNWTIEDSHVESNGTVGIMANNTGSFTIARNRFAGNGDGGLSTIDPPMTVTVTDNTFTGNTNEGAAIGDLSGSTVERNLFENNTTTGLWIGAANSSVADNTIRSNGGDGVFVTLGTSTLALARNLVENSGGNGVRLYVATGVTLTDNQVAGSGATGVLVDGSGATLTTNTITGNTGPGVVVKSSADQITMDRNVFGGNGGIAIDLSATTATLGDGVTVNTATPPSCGTDLGVGNGGLDAPIIDDASATTVVGRACAGATVQVYRAVADVDASDTNGGIDYGEGVEYVGTATADGSGNWTLTGISGLTSGDVVTATATNVSQTSEFSANFTSNAPPVFDQDLLDRTNPEADHITLSAAATDPDGDTLTYSATGLPLGLSIDSGTGMISGVVNHAAAAASPYGVEISVTDGINPATTDTFTWTITNVVTTPPYLVAGSGGAGGGDDLLTTADETNFDPATNEVDIGIGTGTTGIAAIAIEPISGVLFTADGGQLGILNTDGGTYTSVGAGLGIGDGEYGAIAFDSVVGMSFHPLTGEIWAIHNRPGLVDVLFVIDAATGAHIPDAFGAGVDYRKLRQHAGASEFTSLAMDPTDWQLYGTLTDGAGTDYLVSVSRKNGNTKVIGALAQAITDLSFDNTGQMWAIDSSTLYQVTKTSAALDPGRPIDNGSTYEALAFVVDPASPPALEGTVFEDLAGDALAGSQAVEDLTNPGAGEVTVHIYLDNGAVPGEPDSADTLFDTRLTGPTGHYFFEALPPGAYWLAIDSTSINPIAGGTGWAEQTYGPIGAVTYDGSYQFAPAAGPLYGGKQPIASDAPADPATSQHVSRLNLAAGDHVEDVDFGFSFDVVTNLEGGDGTGPQGSIRRFINNATTVNGPNAMRFVPAVPTTGSDGGGNSWWHLAPTVALDAITAPDTTVDGTAYSAADGATVVDLNTAGPELELTGSGGGYGLEVAASRAEVRDLTVNGFASGVAFLGGDGSTVAGSYLGPDATGLVGETGNIDEGVLVYGATNTVVGGTTVADRNVISGNRLRGVFIDDATDGSSPISDGTQIVGNYIGTDAAGTAALPYSGGATPTYQQIGIALWGGPDNVIGTATAGNIISGNEWHGVYIWGADSTGNKVQGNTIGLDATATSTVPNGYDSSTRSAVNLTNATGNLIGGDTLAEGNIIAGNASIGVSVFGTLAIDNAIIGNSIYDNGELGIDLETKGVSANDPGDVDVNVANELLNFPVITSAVETLGTVAVDFELDVPAGDYRIEFFTNSVADPSSHGEGETPTHAYAVMAHPGGLRSYGTTFAGSAGAIVTATTTEDLGTSFGSTSEFSAAVVVTVPDTTAPVITLVGSSPIDVEAGSVYVDAGATAWDDVEGDLTASIVTTNPVDTSTLGTYTVTYNASDSSGNAAAEVTRIVNVVDTIPPVITLLGSTPIDVEAGSVYVDAGATATDSFEGDLTAAIFTVNPVNTALVGTYTITYTVSDSTGNAATPVTRIVNVIDTGNPVITLLGATPIDVEAGSLYVDDGATAWDDGDGDLTASIVTVDPVDTSTLGTYTVTYNVSDSSGNAAAEVTRTVNVVDTTAPVITLLGSTPIDVEAGSVYVDAGATATDTFEGDLTASIFTVNPVNTALVGTYTITYTVSDSTGNAATPITRIVNVVDTTAPVITLLGSTPIDVEAGSVYVDAGATATDTFEGDLTASIFVVNPVNTALVGTYTITYTVSDSTGNAATPITRIVNVIDTTAPVITLLGTTPIDVEAGSVYVDAGATATDSFEGDLTSSIVTVNPVDTSTLGTYTVRYNVSDSQGNAAAEVTRTVNVVNTTAPVITLLGSTPVTVEAGSVYVDAGATATDSFEGDLTASIVTVDPVDTSTLGTYTVTYNVSDSSGNAAAEVTRTVNVVDTTAPVITLLGSTPIDVEAGSVYVDAGATATDTFEGDLTAAIFTVNPVNTALVGTYTITYTVSDSTGNAATPITRIVNVIDTTAPVITLLGTTPIDVEAGTVYVDAGATATDSFEGDLTASIFVVNPVNTALVGTYTITYTVSDSTGNAATPITRIVNVIDTTAPVITLLGSTPIDVEAGSVYVDAGATATDSFEGDLTSSIVTVNPVDTSTLGTYTVRYNVSDSQGNAAAEVTRTVNVVNTTAPVITLLGSTPVTVEAGSVYVDAGATATDSFEGDLTASIVTVDPVDTSTLGTYTVTYNVSDSSGNAAAEVTRTVNVVDTTAPVITLLGSTPIDVEAGTVYVDAGATATDSFEGDLTAAIFTVNPVNTALVGTYTITYTVSDSTGNAATPVTRIVNVIDTTAPVITLLGSTPIDVEAGSVYVDAGATATDNLDGDLTAAIVVTNPVDAGVLGSYTVTYNVTDSQGHAAAEVTRTVNVVDTTAPVITLLGSTPIDVEAGSVYVDAGATAFDAGDGDLTAAIVTVNPVDTGILGTYTVTYNVTDSQGHAAAEVTRIVNVVDTTAPVITLLGTSPIDVEAGSTYTDAGATAWDDGDGDLTASIVTANPVDTSTLGTYTVTYNVTDSQGHTATEVTRTVNVVDTTAPVITLLGTSPIDVEAGSVYVDAGATATDNLDGDLTAAIVVTNPVDTGVLGTHTVTYNVTDSQGHAATEVTRTVNVVDTTAPVITLLGSTPIDVEAGSVYVDAGATATDTFEGDLTASIFTVNPVNTALVGTYTITYTVSDSTGNAATPITRIVNVIDTTAPVITLLGTTPIDVEAGSVYVDAGATATDSFEGDLTSSIVTVNPVNTAALGSYTVTYNVTDAAGNAATEVTRTVNVIDTTPPVISLLGSTPIDVEAGSTYVDAGATAWDNLDGDLTPSIVVANLVDTSTLGTYTVTYNVTDSQGQAAAEVTRTVNVVDTTAPVITLLGSTPIDVEAGSVYTDAGATATDSFEGDLTASIFVVNPVNTSLLGTYTITYTVSDSTGNAATPVTRIVNVIDTSAPVITLLGSTPIDVEAGSVYTDAGATATDNLDGDLTAAIVVTNPVDTGVLGTYTVTYNVTDSQGHAATEVTRTVNVVDTTPPVITLLGDNPQIIEAGSPYVEAGATATDVHDGDVTSSIVINSAAVDTGNVGSYTVFYDVMDAAGNLGSAIRTVNVVDTTDPMITLVGSSPIDVEAGSVYTDAGATAWDAGDGDLTASIVTVNPVDTSTLGTYTVTYNVTDSQGHAAAEVTRTVNVVDTTAPVITLLGSTPIDVEAGSVYVDAGATATDTFEGDLTAAIFTVNPVNTALVGTYTITYTVSDSTGNAATPITRIVNVIDTTAPVITLLGTTPIDVEAGTVYVDAGATATDSFEGDLTSSIVTVNPVNTAALGSYTVTYNVTDAAGNAATEVTRTVNVIDTTPPVISLLGSTPIDVEAGSTYVDAGATATDSFEGDLTSSIVTVNPVDTSTLGTYTVRYNVTDSQGNAAAEVTRTVNVVDTTAPVITLLGSTPIDVEAGTVYVDAGATATDSFEGDLTAAIFTVNPVNTALVGTYTITYTVSDSTGNAATPVTRIVNVIDTTAPVITLLGTTPIDVEAGTAYVDAGATAFDDGDGDLTASIVTTNPVDTGILGSYTVTYNVTDSQGNAATEVTRTVNVVDTTAPVITFLGSTPVTVEAGSVYVDAGATATDSFEGDITSSIVTVNPVNTSTLGTYTITYNVSDSSGNAATEVTRTVNVVDTTAPVITLLGTTPIDVEAGSVYVDAGATATDSFEGDLTASIVTVDPVDTSTLGTYTVTYNVSDSTGNAAAEVTRVVNVVDTTAPVITLLGATPIDVEAGSVYVDAGATATDSFEGDLTASIFVVNPVNTSLLGTYTITYTVSDSTGNAATPVTRIVNVIDTTAPVITLLGSTPIDVEAGTVYVDAGATATDSFEGDLTASIFTVNPVNTALVGTYTITYTVSDSTGNAATPVTRIVNVIDTTAPVITLLGTTPIDVEAGTVYVDAGATAFDDGDGDLTASIVTTNPVDTGILGTYTVRYNVTDSQGNAATEVTRVVNVIDTTPPVITLVGVNPQTIEIGSAYNELGATAWDNGDGDLTSAIIVDASGVDTTTLGTYLVTYDVTDANANAAARITRTVNIVNAPPTLAPVTNRNVTEMTTLTFTANASDPDPTDLLAYSLTTTPSGASGPSIDATTGVFTWRPTEAQGPGVFTFEIVVTDSTGSTDRTSVQISVSEAPRPPVLAGIADATTGEQAAVSFTAIASDPDVPASAVTYGLAGAPAGASINSTSGALWTPTEAQGPGSYTFNVVATDADGLSDSESVMITVTETNVAPVLQAIPRQSVDEGTTLTFAAVATDRDRPANTLTFALIDPPLGALIDPTTGVVSWTPTEAQGPGIHRFSVTVSDNGMVGPATTNASATQPVTIDVDEANQPPLVERPANRVTAAGAFDAITLEGSDPDIPTQQLTWSATGLPPGLSISSSTGRIAGTPLPAGAGAHEVTITLTDDDGAFGSATFTWTIDQPLPGSPIVKDEFYSVDFGGRLTIPAPGVLDNDRDPDGGTLEAHVYAEPTKGTLDLEVSGSFRYVHDAESSGTDTFTYEVIDDEASSAYATATITITNEAPVARDDERSVEEDSYVDLDPVAGNDRDPESYELVIVDWTQPRNGGITTPTTDKNILRYKPDPDYHGLDKFTYIVQDPGGATATATVTVTVTPLNDAPSGVDDSYIIEDYQPAELAVLANDSDVDGDPLRITRVSGAELGIVRILDHRSLSYDPTSGYTGIDTITYTVIDGNGGTTQAKATILIPEAVLAAGEELFDDVAPTNVEISAGETQATTIGGFTIQSVTLMADAFWQTVLALRVPMFFLLLALGSVIVGGGLTNAPIFVAARRKRYYAGVLLHRESFLIAYEEPDTNSDIVYRFQPTARSIHAVGRAQQVDGVDWIPVTTANGKGWIDARHLVQEVDIGTFMEDDRPPQLVADFVERLRSGQSVERLLSRPGLLLALAHDVSFVPASMAPRLAARDRTDESWSGAIAAFLSAYDATAEISPKNPHSSVALLPSECQNFLYLALEPDALGRPWLVYIEYLNKTPHIIGLGIDL